MSTVVLIDLSSIFWAAWHATADKPLGEAFEITVASVQRWAREGDVCAVCCDCPPYFRKELSAAYKAQRDAPEPNAVDQFRRVKDRLRADGLLLWEFRGFEADDVIATATHAATYRGHNVEIISGDKDLLQLVGHMVRQRKPSDGLHIDDEAVEEKFGVPPEQMRDLLALWGDSSDNIPGVPGIGPKKAAALLADFKSIDGILENLAEIPKGKLQDALEEHRDQLLLSRQLVTLRTDVPLDFEEVFRKREPQRLEEEMSEQDYDAEDTMDDPPTEIVTESAPEKVDAKPDAIIKTNGTGGAIASTNFEHGLQPGSLGAAYKLAKGIYESRLYSRFPNAEAIWSIIIRGRELGLGALTALDNFHIVDSKPVASAHLLIARAKAHPDCDYLQFVGGDATYAEAETKNKRAPKPTRLRYTIEQARRAGLVRSGSNWEKRPEDMLNKTVMVKLARLEYPSATAGLYCAEEEE